MSSKPLFKPKARPGTQGPGKGGQLTAAGSGSAPQDGSKQQSGKDKYSPTEIMRRKKKKQSKNKLLELVPIQEPEKNLSKHITLKDEDDKGESEAELLGKKRKDKRDHKNGRKEPRVSEVDAERQRALSIIASIAEKQEAEIQTKLDHEHAKIAFLEEKARKRQERKEREKLIEQAMLRAVLTDLKQKKRAEREEAKSQRLQALADQMSAAQATATTSDSAPDHKLCSEPSEGTLYTPSDAVAAPKKSILKKSTPAEPAASVPDGKKQKKTAQVQTQDHVSSDEDGEERKVTSVATKQALMLKKKKKLAVASKSGETGASSSAKRVPLSKPSSGGVSKASSQHAPTPTQASKTKPASASKFLSAADLPDL